MDETIFIGGCEPTDKTQSPAQGTVFSGDTLDVFLTFTIDGVEGSCNFYIIMDEATNLESPINDDVVTMYPNPAKHSVYIDSPDGINRILVYDITGSQVLTTDKSDFDVSLMNKGMYFVEIKTNTSRIMKRLIVD